MNTPEENFDKLQLELPPTPISHGVYKTFIIVGNFIYVSGHGPYLRRRYDDGQNRRGS